ncbi:astacin-like metalloendopeptidase [Ambystoma mexicanum]|uniref:astacin-like metalloendopeptidase n=1 Tax=Ambystoma mexicanum TaxID=8296 RepID=UPI0037E89CE7
MQLRTVLVSFTCLLGCALPLPLPTPEHDPLQASEAANPTETSIDLEPEIFSIIIEANTDAKIPLENDDIVMIKYRNVLNCPKDICFWPQSSDGRVRVPFILSSVYGTAQLVMIYTAMQEIATMTCVDFVNRTSETNYLSIISSTGCWSGIGKQGGVQTTSLQISSCFKQGIIQHELMHILGFYHEHSRKDRDLYIDIMWQYIKQGDWANLAIERNANTLGLPYDYNSIMHYPRNALTNTTGKSTIVPKPDSTIPIGQRYGLSNLDMAKINKLYKCNLCRTLLTDPSGTISFNQSTLLLPTNGSCLWLIRLPANQVFMWLSDFNIPSSDDCQSSYLRVYDGNSKESPVILEKTCGQGRGLSMMTSGKNMLVELVYIKTNVSLSFNAVYNSGTCKGNYTAKNGIMNGTVTSPNYPNQYPQSTSCTWNIIAPPGYKILLNLVSILFKPQNNCTRDSLRIYDDTKPSSALLGTYCTPSPDTIVSYGSMLRLEFRSDRFADNSGFLVEYTFSAFT